MNVIITVTVIFIILIVFLVLVLGVLIFLIIVIIVIVLIITKLINKIYYHINIFFFLSSLYYQIDWLVVHAIMIFMLFTFCGFYVLLLLMN
jgi:hypothetical protein